MTDQRESATRPDELPIAPASLMSDPGRSIEDDRGNVPVLPEHLIMLASSGRSVRLFTAGENLGWDRRRAREAGVFDLDQSADA